MSKAVENILLNLMREGNIISEPDIEAERRHGILRGFTQEEIKAQLDHLLYCNRIRWVAYRGYMYGGRPENGR